MSDAKSTVPEPVEQREVDFYGDELTAVRLPAGRSLSYTQYLGAGVDDCPFPITAERPFDRARW